METKESSKKKKFDSFPSFIVNMIRNASASSSMTLAESLTDALKSIIDCSTLAQSQTMLNFFLHSNKVNIDASLPLTTAIVSGNWIVRGPVDPGNLSLLLLAKRSSKSKQRFIEKANLKFHLHEVFNSKLLDENLDQIIQMNYVKITSYEELKAWATHSKKFLSILGELSLFVIQLIVLVTHVEEECLLYESAFDLDTLFGTKLAYAVDRLL